MADVAKIMGIGKAEPAPEAPATAADRIYKIKSTSNRSAVGEESLELTLRADDEQKLTKRVIDYELVDNPNDKDAKVGIRFHHLRRGDTKTPWAPVQTFKLSQLQAGEEATLALDSAETLELYRYLNDLYALAQKGIPSGQVSLRVVKDSPIAALLQKGGGQDVLSALIKQFGGDGFIDLLRRLAPDLPSAAVLAAIHEEHSKALAEFEEQMRAGKWTELEWDKFFQRNQWIFGHGLSYKFLNLIKAQAYVGGQSVEREGAKLPDYMMETVGDVRFTVIVEIKRPQTPLLETKATYRDNVYNLGEDLTGGVAQIQAYCDEWKTQSGSRANEKLEAMTYEPKGILVLGTLAQFEGENKNDMARSFELFRRSLHNPEVITFDELLDRARYIVKTSSREPEKEQAKPAPAKD